MEFKPGDTVMLKSGGPVMTIKNIGKYNYSDYDSADCQWFESKKLESGIFPLTSLTMA